MTFDEFVQTHPTCRIVEKSQAARNIYDTIIWDDQNRIRMAELSYSNIPALVACASQIEDFYADHVNIQIINYGMLDMNIYLLNYITDRTPIILYHGMVTSWLAKFLKKYELRKVTLHSLRHTNATLMIAEGVDVCTVSNRLGHANTSTTLNIYAHALKSRDAEAAEKLDNIFSNTI